MVREIKSQSKLHPPPSWRGKHLHTEYLNLAQQKSTNRNLRRNQCWDLDTWTAIDELLEARHIFMSFTSMNLTSFQQLISEKNPFLLSAWKGKRNPFEIYQSTLFSTRSACPQEKLVHQSLTDLGEEKYRLASFYCASVYCTSQMLCFTVWRQVPPPTQTWQLAFLLWSGTEPTISQRYACTQLQKAVTFYKWEEIYPTPAHSSHLVQPKWGLGVLLRNFWSLQFRTQAH